jgi:hypothetical protein
MVTSYRIVHRTCKWTKKLVFFFSFPFFYLPDMTILNPFLIYKSCGGKITHKKFREMLVRELIIHSQEENVTASDTSRGRPSQNSSQHSRMEIKHSQHWPSKEKQAAPLHKKIRRMLHLCTKCDGLCIAKCFEKKHGRLSVSH